jgi:squalene-hopene/tetraprenyl-beta-curcumene cyclase
VEETAVAVEALASWLRQRPSAVELGAAKAAVAEGVGWLIRNTDQGTRFPTAPIGLYFAKLWYSEDLYPLVFSLAALESAAACGALD